MGGERSNDSLRTVMKDGLLLFKSWYAKMSRKRAEDGVSEEFQVKVTVPLMTQEAGLSRMIFGVIDATFSI